VGDRLVYENARECLQGVVVCLAVEWDRGGSPRPSSPPSLWKSLRLAFSIIYDPLFNTLLKRVNECRTIPL
jgi:hypothetical protein